MENPDSIILKCNISSTNSSVPLGMRVSIDNQTVYENLHVKNEENFEFAIIDDNAEHDLVFELFNKLPEHTKINNAGEIVEDALLVINDLTIDDINISEVLRKLAVYSHDYNGSQPLAEGKFYGTLGCNGNVKLKFAAPIYLWLLENL